MSLRSSQIPVLKNCQIPSRGEMKDLMEDATEQKPGVDRQTGQKTDVEEDIFGDTPKTRMKQKSKSLINVEEIIHEEASAESMDAEDTTKSKQKLGKHLKSKAEIIQSDTQNLVSGLLRHVCEECGERFYKRSHLKKHIKMTHTGQMVPFDDCEGEFSKETDMLQNYNTTHLGKESEKNNMEDDNLRGRTDFVFGDNENVVNDLSKEINNIIGGNRSLDIVIECKVEPFDELDNKFIWINSTISEEVPNDGEEAPPIFLKTELPDTEEVSDKEVTENKDDDDCSEGRVGDGGKITKIESEAWVIDKTTQKRLEKRSTAADRVYAFRENGENNDDDEKKVALWPRKMSKHLKKKTSRLGSVRSKILSDPEV
jgi:hypothetical protein